MVGGELDFFNGLGFHKTLKDPNLEITPDRKELFRQFRRKETTTYRDRSGGERLLNILK